MKRFLKNSYNLPWKYNDAPHAVLDVIRGCNIKCAACYNNAELKIKTFDEVKADYEKISKCRKVSAISIVGGEPLLNKNLIEIIKFLKTQNLAVQLFTNALLLNEEKAKELAQAGVNIVMLHIDIGQQRPDLPKEQTQENVNNLITEKAKMLYRYGIEVGISATVKNSDIDNTLSEKLEFFKQSKFINYFLVTLFRDITSYGQFVGDMDKVVTGKYIENKNPEEPNMQKLMEKFNSLGLEPYTYITAHYDKNSPRWLCYLYAASYKIDKLKYTSIMKNSKFERLFMKVHKLLKGYYPFYTKQNCVVNSIYMLLNGLTGGYFFKNISFLFKSIDKYKKLKRIVVQEPASVNSNGYLELCESCPDMTVNNGKLVPVCVCDNFS